MVSAQSLAYRYIRIGNPTDAHVTPAPGFALMGGGADLDEAFRWLCTRAHGGDFLILRATGTDAYNSYVQHLCTLNSVATLIIPSRAAADELFVANTIGHASALFIAGGDQANYINFWMSTPLEAALNEAIARGVPIGGTSAGLAVLGEFAYSAQGDTPGGPDLDSKTALADPFGPRITLVRGFLSIPILKGILTDTHFARRDRMGRLLAFLARLHAPDGKPAPAAAVHGALYEPPGFNIRGIGVDERAAILLEPTGEAHVIGSGHGAWFIDAAKGRDALGKETPLTFGPYDVQHVAPGQTFNIELWRGEVASYSLQVENGVIHSTQPSNSVY